MATEYRINMKRYNGTDYDIMYPRTLIEQVTNGQRQIIVDTVSLGTSWTGTGPYTQVVTIDGIESDSKIDIQPDADVINKLMESGTTALYIVNDSGVATAVALGAAPNAGLEIQCTITKTVAAPAPPLNASIKARSGITYTNGISGISAEKMSLYANLISNNASITNETNVVYIDDYELHYKVSVGDQVTLALNGTDYAFDIIGFNHDTLTTAAAYGANTATGKAGITFQMHDCFATTYAMNSSDTNSGGWKSSAMRISTMATMKGYLPDDWEAIIKPVNKASGTGSDSSSGTETVSDSCFLLAEIEIFGSTKYSVSGEGTQYEYYKAGNTKVKNKSGSANIWWERSPHSGASSSFCLVSNKGNYGNSNASTSRGVAFCFCV